MIIRDSRIIMFLIVIAVILFIAPFVVFLALDMSLIYTIRATFAWYSIVIVAVLVAGYFLLPIPRKNLVAQFANEGAQFFTTPSGRARFAVQKPDASTLKWEQCLIAVWRDYVTVYPRTLLIRDVIAFNGNNLRWMGRIQRVTEDREELSLDIQFGDGWFTIIFELTEPDMKQFEAEILRLRPETITSERSRRRPNLRSGPFVMYLVGGPLVDIVDTVQLYITPLWLVILANGVVLSEFPLNEIRKCELIDNFHQIRFEVDDEVWSFESPDNLDTVGAELMRVISSSPP